MKLHDRAGMGTKAGFNPKDQCFEAEAAAGALYE
jgi:hypothetical protein